MENVLIYSQGKLKFISLSCKKTKCYWCSKRLNTGDIRNKITYQTLYNIANQTFILFDMYQFILCNDLNCVAWMNTLQNDNEKIVIEQFKPDTIIQENDATIKQLVQLYTNTNYYKTMKEIICKRRAKKWNKYKFNTRKLTDKEYRFHWRLSEKDLLSQCEFILNRIQQEHGMRKVKIHELNEWLNEFVVIENTLEHIYHTWITWLKVIVNGGNIRELINYWGLDFKTIKKRLIEGHHISSKYYNPYFNQTMWNREMLLTNNLSDYSVLFGYVICVMNVPPYYIFFIFSLSLSGFEMIHFHVYNKKYLFSELKFI